ncbi:protein HGV2-like [Argiope bruennichi]|uniref:Histone-binding protein N1/N2 like protein n=1 Tax=Argiope bruennichi TaxID=94029 RepID=A0A8T0FBS3_ARGBR|nr:protein HGV2-like [Argiope bruennichi]KAF8788361.1 Histone-binding protein N1/N2 like protein [Argiope bruennichi]
MEESKEVKDETKPVDESPSRSKDLSKTLPEEAFNNFLQGKRHILVQDYLHAVQSLSTACELYTQHFGELALECGEVHFLYGKALFRLSQQQAGILGGALNEEVNDDEDEDEDEPEKSSEEEGKENEGSEKNDSDTENGEENQEDTEATVTTKEDEKEPSESTDSPQHIPEETSKEPIEKEGEQSAVAENEANANEEQQETEEDDLELAWNSLETAKSIYLRQGEDNVEAQLKVAEILQLLAEISMESDNNTAAINDLKACLEIKKRHLNPDDRLLAETYYQMGLAQMLEKMYVDALENFRTTVKILELKIQNLKSTPIPDIPGSFDKADVEKEIEDLESVLSDIREKIEDTRELIEDAKKALEDRIIIKRNELEKVGFPEADKSTSKPVSNITHLLKRKKPDQEEEERESKRSKLSNNVQNGDTTVTE